jgi:hypothetical protein
MCTICRNKSPKIPLRPPGRRICADRWLHSLDRRAGPGKAEGGLEGWLDRPGKSGAMLPACRHFGHVIQMPTAKTATEETSVTCLIIDITTLKFYDLFSFIMETLIFMSQSQCSVFIKWTNFSSPRAEESSLELETQCSGLGAEEEVGAEWEVAGLELLIAGRILPVVGPG